MGDIDIMQGVISAIQTNGAIREAVAAHMGIEPAVLLEWLEGMEVTAVTIREEALEVEDED